MNMGELFAGIGGFSLGFRRAGFDVKWQVEIDPYCRKVLAKNFPEAERFEDVRKVGAANLQPVDVICGGFPCQDISIAGNQAGLDGERSGLWREFFRVVRELRPRFAVVENVSALLGLGIDRVLADLSSVGFDAEWEVIPATFVGAPHLRKRLWLVAYPMRQGQQGHISRPVVFKPAETPFSEHRNAGFDEWQGLDHFAAGLPEIDGLSVGLVRRRVHALGNAVVPQIPEWIANRILQARAA